MKPLICLVTVLLSIAPPTRADAIIDLSLTKQSSKAKSTDPLRLSVSNGTALFAAASGAPDKDLRFNQAQNVLQLIDHRHHSYMLMDEPSVIQFTDQTAQMLSMARGFAEQLALLPPKQRVKLENMIGGNPLGNLAKPIPNLLGKQSLRTAAGKTINGVTCRMLEIISNGKKLAELCLANAAAIPINAQDYATLEAMRQLMQRLALRAAPLAQQLGYPVPPLDDARLSGLPIEMKNLIGNGRETVTLTQISSEPVAAQLLEIPAGYKSKPLSALKF